MVLGAGNVATHISRHLHFAGHNITCIWSRSRARAQKLADEFGSAGTADPGKVPSGADFYLVAVPDRAIPDVTGKYRGSGGIWIHTAGAVSMDVLEKDFEEFGVFYPLQTLSADQMVSLEDTPFLVEGSGPQVTRQISALASSISETVIEMDSSSRLVIHMAAVFANNFSNHMVTIAERILKENKGDLELLAPILRETFSKMVRMGPENAQTGPALRNDQVTIQKHLELLKAYPEWEKLYTFVSRDIGRTRQSTIDPESGNDQF